MKKSEIVEKLKSKKNVYLVILSSVIQNYNFNGD